jgi:hypothetical protein
MESELSGGEREKFTTAPSLDFSRALAAVGRSSVTQCAIRPNRLFQSQTTQNIFQANLKAFSQFSAPRPQIFLDRDATLQ